MSRMLKALALLAAPLAAVSLPAPSFAQADGEMSEDEMAQVMATLGEMFPSDPLTAEQQARLPAATAVVDKIILPGTMEEMMGAMFDGMLGPMMDGEFDQPKIELAKLLGAQVWELDIEDDAAREAVTLLDPAWQERKRLEAEVMPRVMGEIMVAMEPTVKSAMSELYAIYFDMDELADIDAFFSTQSGAAYARKSFTMSADPRLAGAMMEGMPTIMASVSDMQAQMQAATADLPAPRSVEDLSAQERARLAELTGLEE